MTALERLEELKSYSGNTTWAGLAKLLGLSNAQIFTDVKMGKCGISGALATKINAVFPELNPVWLITGDGEMVVSKMGGTFIPLYNSYSDTACSIRDGSSKKSINIGDLFPGADIALINPVNDMVEYPENAILILSKVGDDEILRPGWNYMFATDNAILVRRFQYGSESGTYSLYATNDATNPDGRIIYEPIQIKAELVGAIYKVIGYVMAQSPNI